MMQDELIKNSRELEFVIFCIENVAEKLGVAADRVYQAFTGSTVELFFDGLIDRKEAINRLRFEKTNLQICFCTGKALEFLHFKGSEMV